MRALTTRLPAQAGTAAVAAQVHTLSRSAADPLGLLPLLEAPRYDAQRALAALGQAQTPWGPLHQELTQLVTPRKLQTLGEHTLRVAGAHERYFGALDEQALGMSQGMRRLTLLLHDAGKSAAIRLGGSKNLQHEYTEQLLTQLRPVLPVSDEGFRRMRAMILGDPFGPYLRDDAKHVPLEPTLRELTALARQAGMSPPEYMRALTSYYQADLAAYTHEAGLAWFDDAFRQAPAGSARQLVFDRAAARLRFNDANEKKWAALEKAVARQASAGSGAPEQKSWLRRFWAWLTGA